MARRHRVRHRVSPGAPGATGQRRKPHEYLRGDQLENQTGRPGVPEQLKVLGRKVLALLPELDDAANTRVIQKEAADGRTIVLASPSTLLGIGFTAMVLPAGTGETMQFDWSADGTMQHFATDHAEKGRFNLDDIAVLAQVISDFESHGV